MKWRAIATCTVLMATFAVSGISQEKGDKKPTGRLPNNFGKLDLTAAQKEKIYTIQGKYTDQIDDLKKQLQALEDKRDKEVEGVLNAEQKTKLKSLSGTSKSAKDKDDEKEMPAKESSSKK